MGVITRHLIMSPHLNSNNTLFGGTLLAWLDEAGAIMASKEFKSEKIVTLLMDTVKFTNPGFINEMVTIKGEVTHRGNTSITLGLKAQVYNVENKFKKTICETEIVFVDLNKREKLKNEAKTSSGK